jgi:serine/threonine protein phosphatase PrpC
MKLRGNDDRAGNIFTNINIREDRSADRVKDPPRIITADITGKKKEDLNRSVNLKSTRTGQMYSAQTRNNLLLNNLYGENYKDKNYIIKQRQHEIPNPQNLLNKDLNQNLNNKNNSIFNHDNLNNFLARNQNNVYTPLNNNIRKNLKNNNLQNNNNLGPQKQVNDSSRVFSPANRNLLSGISANNKNRNFSSIANKTQKKPVNTVSNNNSLETINGYNNIIHNNLNSNRIYSSNLPNSNLKGNSIKPLFQSNYDTVNLVNTPNNKNRNIEGNDKLKSSENSNKGTLKENFENYNNLNNNHNLTFLSGPEKIFLNIIEDNSTEINKNEGTKNICNLNAKSVREYAYREDRNFTYRHAMEDYSRIIDRYMSDSTKGIFCLFDGHGGSEPVKYARDRLPEILSKFLSDNKNNIEKSLTSSFQKLDEELKNQMECENSGSTACVIYIFKDNDLITGGRKTFYCANVGDTRCLLISNNGFKRMSFDHKCTDEGEVARIRKVGGVVFNGRVFGQLALSRALGDHAMKKYGVTAIPFINKHIVNDRDKYIILCSDGVWDVNTDDDVYKMSSKIKNADEYAALVINTSLEKGSRDNISCIVIKIN